MGISSGHRRRYSPLAGMIAGSVVALGCGSAREGTAFPSPGGASAAPALDDGGDASSDESLALFADSGQFTTVFTGGDGAAPPVMFACEPGTYSGTFTTMVTTDAGGILSSLFSFNWTGTLSIVLVGHVIQTQSANGENFAAAPVLTIAPGAMLSGTDNFGGHFSSGLSGQLDCPSKQLTGTLSNGTYEYPGDSGNIVMQGTLSATYAGTTPPALTMGAIQVSSPSYSTLGATGTWSATLQ